MWLIVRFVLTKQRYIEYATRCVRAGEMQRLRDKDEFLALCHQTDVISKLLREAHKRQYTSSVHSVDEIVRMKNGQRRSMKLGRAIRYYQHGLVAMGQEMDAFNVRYDKHCASLRHARALLDELLKPDIASDSRLVYESLATVVPSFTQQLST